MRWPGASGRRRRWQEPDSAVLNVDLQDFFPSITFPRVRGLFMKHFAMPSEPATVLARICCNTGDYPQQLALENLDGAVRSLDRPRPARPLRDLERRVAIMVSSARCDPVRLLDHREPARIL